MTTQLTHDVLDDWLDAILSAGAPASAIAGESVDDTALDALISELGLCVPTELRELWSWRTFTGAEMGLHARILTPANAVSETQKVRDWHRQAHEDGNAPADGWSHDLLVWNNAHPYWFSVDASSEAPLSPVLVTVDYDLTESPEQEADSLGELFTFWTHEIRNGNLAFQGHWHGLDSPFPG